MFWTGREGGLESLLGWEKETAIEGLSGSEGEVMSSPVCVGLGGRK